jgi:ATP phosphoribosyltransferase
VEVTETGSTIKAHGLKIIKELMESNTQLIANKESYKDDWKKEKIGQIILLLKGALRAENLVGLKMNVPEDKLDSVISILPSLNAPTVAGLYKTKWTSIETVVDSKVVRELIPKLINAGAEGIIEYPLNKVI